MGFAIDWTFRAGDLAVIATIAVASISWVFKMGQHSMRFAQLESKVTKIEAVQEEIAEILRTIAVQGSRLNRAEQDIHDMKRGRGFDVTDILHPKGA